MKPLVLENVVFDYKVSEDESVRAVNGLSLEIGEGEFVAVIGHNGSGKSTLAKLMNGLLTPTEGRVLIYSTDTKDTKALKKARSNVGVVFQNPDNQLVASKVEDDIAFGPENLGVTREEIRERVEFAIKAVGMEAERESSPYRLSGGQKQRVAIAGVLALRPRVLVLDESTAMLDPGGRAEVLRVAKDLNKNGMAVVLITHFMDEALEADRLLVMNDGQIVADDRPETIFSSYGQLKEINLSIPLVTRIAARIKEAGLPINDKVMTDTALTEELWRLL